MCLTCRIALFHEEEYESAKEALEEAKELGAAGEVDRWLGKCNAELEGASEALSVMPSKTELRTFYVLFCAALQWPALCMPTDMSRHSNHHINVMMC